MANEHSMSSNDLKIMTHDYHQEADYYTFSLTGDSLAECSRVSGLADARELRGRPDTQTVALARDCRVTGGWEKRLNVFCNFFQYWTWFYWQIMLRDTNTRWNQCNTVLRNGTELWNVFEMPVFLPVPKNTPVSYRSRIALPSTRDRTCTAARVSCPRTCRDRCSRCGRTIAAKPAYMSSNIKVYPPGLTHRFRLL